MAVVDMIEARSADVDTPVLNVEKLQVSFKTPHGLVRAVNSVSYAIRPGEAEVARNPRSRSSVLRHAQRTSAPAREAA